MFNQKELSILLGGSQIPIDLQDFKMHTAYGGEYHAEHPTIILFWKAIESFSEAQLQCLIKFVTSCPRPPLLGFRELRPLLCIRHAGSETDRLPTASTCVNLLKLPEYRDLESLKEKLLYAIQSSSGFELS
jgi:ubiquitin-protein ligase E3 C